MSEDGVKVEQTGQNNGETGRVNYDVRRFRLTSEILTNPLTSMLTRLLAVENIAERLENKVTDLAEITPFGSDIAASLPGNSPNREETGLQGDGSSLTFPVPSPSQPKQAKVAPFSATSINRPAWRPSPTATPLQSRANPGVNLGDSSAKELPETGLSTRQQSGQRVNQFRQPAGSPLGENKPGPIGSSSPNTKGGSTALARSMELLGDLAGKALNGNSNGNSRKESPQKEVAGPMGNSSKSFPGLTPISGEGETNWAGRKENPVNQGGSPFTNTAWLDPLRNPEGEVTQKGAGKARPEVYHPAEMPELSKSRAAQVWAELADFEPYLPDGRTLADLINEELQQQAARHGVDLS